MHYLTQTLKYEFLALWRNSQAMLNPLLFFTLVALLFPLAIGPDKAWLTHIAPGVLWVAALLSSLLSLESLFQPEYHEGSLEQLIISSAHIPTLLFIKIAMHWLFTGLPLVLAAPLLGLCYYLPMKALGYLMLSLLLGTPVLSFLGAIVAALLVSLKEDGMLLALLLLPLWVPVLILGAGGVMTYMKGLPVQGEFILMSALFILVLSVTPWAIQSALKVGIND